jgi:hypothetical protein
LKKEIPSVRDIKLACKEVCKEVLNEEGLSRHTTETILNNFISKLQERNLIISNPNSPSSSGWSTPVITNDYSKESTAPNLLAHLSSFLGPLPMELPEQADKAQEILETTTGEFAEKGREARQALVCY